MTNLTNTTETNKPLTAKVTNMESGRGNKIPNQFIIKDEAGNEFFQSYDTIIVKIDKSGKIYLDSEKWNYSNTTSKYRNIFLNETTKETENKIKAGKYELVNLN